MGCDESGRKAGQTVGHSHAPGADCSEILDRVFFFLDNELDQADCAQIQQHLDESLMLVTALNPHIGYEKAAEIARIQERSGARAVSREDAEAELFGSAAGLVGDSAAAEIDEGDLLSARDPAAAKDLAAYNYSQEEIDRGVALNAALILEDPQRLRETARDVEAAGAAAGLKLKVVDWQEASGLVGRFVTLSRLIERRSSHHSAAFWTKPTTP